MSGPRVSPCNWPLTFCGVADGEPEQCASLASLQPAVAELVQQMAVEYLWHWTGRQFGTCPVTVRPCRDICPEYYTTFRGRAWRTTNIPYEGSGYGPLNPALIGGQWFNLPCGGCSNDPCSCTYVPTVTLAGPVASIDEVLLGGVALDGADYRVDNYRYLVRTDGGDWPACQDQLADPTVEGSNTFQVTYQLGIEVPAGGQIAAGVLACEMAKAVCGSGSCQLPQRVQAVTRQGVTVNMLDSYTGLYEFGTVGIPVVDMWVASLQASQRRQGGRVMTPGIKPRRRTTTP